MEAGGRTGESTDYIGVPPETIERRPETFREFVERIEPGRMLSLHHADLPHSPYQYTASGRRYTTDTDLPGLSAEQWTQDPAPVRTGLRRYLMQLGLVDKLVGELVGRLKRIGLFDRAWSSSRQTTESASGRATRDATSARRTPGKSPACRC